MDETLQWKNSRKIVVVCTYLKGFYLIALNRSDDNLWNFQEAYSGKLSWFGMNFFEEKTFFILHWAFRPWKIYTKPKEPKSIIEGQNINRILWKFCLWCTKFKLIKDLNPLHPRIFCQKVQIEQIQIFYKTFQSYMIRFNFLSQKD